MRQTTSLGSRLDQALTFCCVWDEERRLLLVESWSLSGLWLVGAWKYRQLRARSLRASSWTELPTGEDSSSSVGDYCDSLKHTWRSFPALLVIVCGCICEHEAFSLAKWVRRQDHGKRVSCSNKSPPKTKPALTVGCWNRTYKESLSSQNFSTPKIAQRSPSINISDPRQGVKWPSSVTAVVNLESMDQTPLLGEILSEWI